MYYNLSSVKMAISFSLFFFSFLVLSLFWLGNMIESFKLKVTQYGSVRSPQLTNFYLFKEGKCHGFCISSIEYGRNKPLQVITMYRRVFKVFKDHFLL